VIRDPGVLCLWLAEAVFVLTRERVHAHVRPSRR
jgi:hypothetical protein